MRQYWIRHSQSLDAQGNPVSGTETMNIMKGQGPEAVIVDKTNNKEWAVTYVNQMNRENDHDQLKEDFTEVLDTMHKLAYHLDAMTEHMMHLPSKQTAEALIRRAQRLYHDHKKEVQK